VDLTIGADWQAVHGTTLVAHERDLTAIFCAPNAGRERERIRDGRRTTADDQDRGSGAGPDSLMEGHIPTPCK
jgi:hypothetical protein